ncbi:unnamed protein product, partial [Polarella glacialis]
VTEHHTFKPEILRKVAPSRQASSPLVSEAPKNPLAVVAAAARASASFRRRAIGVAASVVEPLKDSRVFERVRTDRNRSPSPTLVALSRSLSKKSVDEIAGPGSSVRSAADARASQ